MNSFQQLSLQFEEKFKLSRFPEEPANLYKASQHLLALGGKRVRPVLCLMGTELFGEVGEDAYYAAQAIELFHNFTLVHDDIMDEAPLRRGFPTVHKVYGSATALLAGDVLFVAAYEQLSKINDRVLPRILELFNKVARMVCEGQQMDMDFANMPSGTEVQNEIIMEDYIKMITLKTSVLLAGSLQTGAILGGAGLGNQQHLYEFGKNLGIAFQVQDDYLDAFGDPGKFGKKPGGDIMANKKTFLLLQAQTAANSAQKSKIEALLHSDSEEKIAEMIQIYKDCKVDQWAKELKQEYLSKAMFHLEEVAVVSSRKKPLIELANYLMDRDV